jgi:hypothetical protein
MYFVLTAKKNIRPNTATELLDRICNIIVDYCGVINEESVRKNFLLIYELVDEVFVWFQEILFFLTDSGFRVSARNSYRVFEGVCGQYARAH